MILSNCIHPSSKPQIKEEKEPVAVAVPPPPLSALPGGFLKQLVRDSEKETKYKEPEVKDDRAVSGSSFVSLHIRSELLKIQPDILVNVLICSVAKR